MIRGVEIKKLDWYNEGDSLVSRTVFGNYVVWPVDLDDDKEWFSGASSNGLTLPNYGSIGEAMAACQTDFDKHILSLITFVVEPSPEEVAQLTHRALYGDGREDSFDGFFGMIENKAHQALIDLLSWSPEFTGPDDMPWADGMGETADRWAEVPFLTETFLYSTLGKDDARSLLTRVDKMISSLGIDPFEFRLNNGLFPFIKQ